MLHVVVTFAVSEEERKALRLAMKNGLAKSATYIDKVVGDIEEAKDVIITLLVKEIEGKPYVKYLTGNLYGKG